MEFIDICAGIGGFRSGLEKVGFKCIGFVEIDKFARNSYEAMYDTNGEWTAEDIREVRPEDIPGADLWCFGFPCQDISVAGRQKGLKGERSGIFYDIIKLLKSKSTEDRPEWLLIENVKNLLTIDGGWAFTEVLSEISEAGYDTEWAVLNSKDFGVPQNRERVFIIGHLRNRGRQEVLSQTGTSGQIVGESQKNEINCLIPSTHYQDYVQSSEGISRTLTARDYKDPQKIAIPRQLIPGPQAKRVYDSEGLSVTLKAEGGGMGAKTGLYAVPKNINPIIKNRHSYETILDPESISGTVMARDYKGPFNVAVPCLTPDRLNKRQNGRRFKEDGDPMFTLTAQDRHGVLLHNGTEYYIRRLTPRECFRLQGFTDEQFDKAQAVNSNTQLYKQAGNAVTVNVAEYIGNLIKNSANG